MISLSFSVKNTLKWNQLNYYEFWQNANFFSIPMLLNTFLNILEKKISLSHLMQYFDDIWNFIAYYLDYKWLDEWRHTRQIYTCSVNVYKHDERILGDRLQYRRAPFIVWTSYWRAPLILASSVDIDERGRYWRTQSLSARAQLRLSNSASIAGLKYLNLHS